MFLRLFATNSGGGSSTVFVERLEERRLLSVGHHDVPHVYAPHSTVRGETLGEYSAQWWQWALSFQTATSPLFDLTGAQAGKGDVGKVFFLAGLVTPTPGPGGVFGATRNITLPTGTPVFFPLINTEADPVGVDPTPSAADVIALAKSQIDGVNALHATLDGRPISDLFSRREVSPGAFSYTLPATDNIYQFFGLDITGTISPAASDGYWVMLKPLNKGHHVLNFGGENAPIDFKLDLTYNIDVVPKGHFQKDGPPSAAFCSHKKIYGCDSSHLADVLN